MPSVLEALNQALHRAFMDCPDAILLGEDVLDPYGGAFKVSKGLSSAYPKRVFTTPISEAGICGVAAGMALRGLHPIVEIMFGDFLTLAADQLINHIAKFRWMYNDQVRVPLVIRTPMGGRRGYGPTHSQTLEKHFLGVPGLHTLAPSAFGDPGELLYKAILEAEDPMLFIENKLLYLLPVHNNDTLQDFELVTPQRPGLTSGNGKPFAPAHRLRVRAAPKPRLTIAAYGYMAELAKQAIHKLAFQYEIFAELVVLTRLAPFEGELLFESIQQTGALLVVEEGSLSFGWGAEVIARATQAVGTKLQQSHRVAAQDLPVPASATLESAVLPGVDDIVQVAKSMV
ncbi:MAG TPA: transketolase C-terminal domain-containing protein [Anaerolineales bacterium]|nr:transketolase C-terminal domain-containing protein [Anaerolineales bacterium]